MTSYDLQGIRVSFLDEEPSTVREAQAYLDDALGMHGKALISLAVRRGAEYAELNCGVVAVPFERIRRITGYLVGTVDRWNDGKRAELAARVTHGADDDALPFDEEPEESTEDSYAWEGDE